MASWISERLFSPEVLPTPGFPQQQSFPLGVSESSITLQAAAGAEPHLAPFMRFYGAGESSLERHLPACFTVAWATPAGNSVTAWLQKTSDGSHFLELKGQENFLKWVSAKYLHYLTLSRKELKY